MEEQEKTGAYGERPIWQWIVIYLIIGAIVYGAIYYLFIAKRGSSPYGSSSPRGNYQTY
ncbi:MAG: hypothetical protein Q7S03_04040 [bacterium]|nr:hypothetical protein [bacterium]